MNRKPKYLYSVWRNRDDKLLILDGNAEECAQVMGMTDVQSFYHLLCMKKGRPKYTITRILAEEAERQQEDEDEG